MHVPVFTFVYNLSKFVIDKYVSSILANLSLDSSPVHHVIKFYAKMGENLSSKTEAFTGDHHNT